MTVYDFFPLLTNTHVQILLYHIASSFKKQIPQI